MKYKLYLVNIFFVTAIIGSVASHVAYLEDTSIASELKNETDQSSYRLPKDIVPISYDLWLHTRLGERDFAYQGNVKITVKVLKPTNTIIVHNDGLIIEKEKSWFYQRVEDWIDLIISIKEQRYDTEKQFYIIDFAKSLEPGEYVLILHFEGEVRNDVFGFYRSSYSVNGETKWMGVTQFSPTYARRAFPCMDEPHLKAIFTLHINHTENQTATSNTQIESILKNPNNNSCLTTFLPTPRMSTYLVGWTVHDFVPETSISSECFKIWTRSSMNHYGSLALNQGRLIYSSLEEWFSVDNPIPKMDQFAVSDFNFNAMENWGMITFRESVVLYENGVTPTRSMINGLTTMAHEYAHTWFGNLVTPNFWDVVWLKEGFASYFQYFGVFLTQPHWRMMEKFVVDTLQPTLLLDSAVHKRTMNGQEVGDPSSIMSTLDFVSYRKGATIIRMLCHVIGNSAFQTGLRDYLKNMSYQAAVPFDLYEHLQNASNKLGQLEKDVLIKDIVESWANQPGYPLVTVTRNYTTQALVVSQERFYQNRSKSTTELEKSRWWIPLNFATKSMINDFSSTAPRSWLRPQDKSLIIDPIHPEDWVIFNVQQVGYYRVNYDENNWRLLTDSLRSKDFRKIHRVNRAALLDDAFNLARAGYIDYSIPFNLSSYLIQESEYEPWVAAANNFKFLNKMLSSVPSVHRSFQEYAVRLLEPMYKQLGFSESPYEDFTIKLHRELILSISCSVNNAHCLETAKTLFGSWISVPSKKILQDVRSFVYCEGIRNGNENDWYTMWDRFLHTDLHTEQELLLYGLGCTQSPNLIDKYLNSSISLEHGIRKQYRILIFNAVLEGNPKNADYTLEFVNNNFQRMIDTRGHNFLSKVITAIGNKLTTDEQAEKLRLFVDAKMAELGTALSDAKLAIASSVANAEWIKKYSSSIANCLA